MLRIIIIVLLLPLSVWADDFAPPQVIPKSDNGHAPAIFTKTFAPPLYQEPPVYVADHIVGKDKSQAEKPARQSSIRPMSYPSKPALPVVSAPVVRCPPVICYPPQYYRRGLFR